MLDVIAAGEGGASRIPHGFIDRKGEMVIGAAYLLAGDFSEGLAPVLIPDR